MAEGLLAGGPDRTVAELLDAAANAVPVGPVAFADDALNGGFAGGPVGGVAAPVPAPAESMPVPAAPSAAPVPSTPAAPPTPTAPAEEEDGELTMGPYIETDLCTSCNECININKRMFGYNDTKQAFIQDPKAGTFAELVRAAEQCPAGIIHPGTPLDPNEPDLDKWRARAEPFL